MLCCVVGVVVVVGGVVVCVVLFVVGVVAVVVVVVVPALILKRETNEHPGPGRRCNARPVLHVPWFTCDGVSSQQSAMPGAHSHRGTCHASAEALQHGNNSNAGTGACQAHVHALLDPHTVPTTTM